MRLEGKNDYSITSFLPIQKSFIDYGSAWMSMDDHRSHKGDICGFS